MLEEIEASAGATTIGAILRRQGAVGEHHVTAALADQRRSGARLGEILVARGWTDQRAIAVALAEQASLGFVDLQPGDLDPALVAEADLDIYLRHRFIPWHRDGASVAYAAVDPAEAAIGLAALAGGGGHTVHLVSADAFERAVLHAHGPALARRGAIRCAERDSARARSPVWQKLALVALSLGFAGGLYVAPVVTAIGAFVVLVSINAMNALARVAVLGAALRRGVAATTPADAAPSPVEPGAAGLAARGPLPMVSILVPLLREPEVVPLLIEALEGLDWPHERLDVLLLLEADDDATAEALQSMRMPPFARVLVVPPGGPRTKPRALNIGLDFARGDIIGIYDAEDRPEPDQLRRVAAILANSPPEVVSVQCRLGYYNGRENWITRCFAIEYAMWFDVLIAGFRDLRLPIPLGGTSVFFRRRALEELGGWDAHNVTEDADLGMRLARRGWRCEVSASTTYEEANSRLLPWIRQRSRWLKGYMTTWLVHLRRPLSLWRELGPVGFLGFQTVFLGGIVAYLGLPLFWVMWASVLVGLGPAWLGEQPIWAIWTVGVVQLSGWLAMLVAAVIATTRRRQAWLLPSVVTLLFYWPIGALSAYLALAEMFLARSFWRKTRHGVGRLAEAELARARARQAALSISEVDKVASL
jgi:cellulose synthase/poly-beta-1,6-N-acetylglucosamine synthase-like glycosyltransferase